MAFKPIIIWIFLDEDYSRVVENIDDQLVWKLQLELHTHDFE